MLQYFFQTFLHVCYRCIHENHRTFSMGIKWLFIRLLGEWATFTNFITHVSSTACGRDIVFLCFVHCHGKIFFKFHLTVDSHCLCLKCVDSEMQLACVLFGKLINALYPFSVLYKILIHFRRIIHVNVHTKS